VASVPRHLRARDTSVGTRELEVSAVNCVTRVEAIQRSKLCLASNGTNARRSVVIGRV